MITLELEGFKSCNWSTLPTIMQAYLDIADANNLVKVIFNPKINYNTHNLDGVYFKYLKENLNENNLQVAHEEWLSICASNGIEKQATGIIYQ